jgi:hypothetical protein
LLDREAEEIEAQNDSPAIRTRARQVYEDRDNLRAELQFYIDLTEALNYTPDEDYAQREGRSESKGTYVGGKYQ